MPKIDTLNGPVVPVVGTTAGARNVGVPSRAKKQAAGEAVQLGRQLSAQVLHLSTDPAPIRAIVTDPAGIAGEPDALRSRIKTVPDGDAQPAAELKALLPKPPAATAPSDRSVAIGRDDSGFVSTGNYAMNTRR